MSDARIGPPEEPVSGPPERESAEAFRLLVASVKEYAIFLLDPQGRIASWNVGARRIKGYEASEIIGKHFSAFYPAEAIAQGKPEWELRTAIEQGSVEDEGWRIRKDGTRFWANVVITALVGSDGELRGFAKVTRDMTERRRIDALQEADRQKDQFLALLAHELRNPLAPIRNALHVLGQPMLREDQAERARRVAERQVQHMARLLDDLLDVARFGQGKMHLSLERVDLSEVVSRSVDAARGIMQERRHTLVVTLPPEPLWVEADSTRLEQVTSNLLQNAAKYTDPGGKVFVAAAREGEDLLLRVKDTGIGVEAPMLSRIFDLFVQGERRTDKASGGIGIGLTLVKRLVELQGGSVAAFSAGQGKGSEFVVRLPAAKASSKRPGESGDHEKLAHGTSLRILVVDDNVDAADSLSAMLELFGHEVRTAYDGEEALRTAASVPPDAAVLDIGMPDMDGYELARRLRALPETKGVLLIAMTGWGQDEDLRRTAEAGFDEHLVKPADPDALQRLLVARRRAP